jgi:predicted nicotinamide N-methyase
MDDRVPYGRNQVSLNTADRVAFVRANTQLRAVPLVPEISLHIADEAVPLWKKTEEQMIESGVPPPFWAFAWAGGQALARHVLDNPSVVTKKRVLDFGSGSGLVAIAAAKSGAKSVEACDIDEFAIAAIEINARANNTSIRTIGKNLIGRDEGWNVVLAADVCYDREMAANVFDWLIVLSGCGAEILIGDPGRSYLPKDKLKRIAEYRVPVTRELEDTEIKNTGVWQLLSRDASVC